MAVSGGRRTYQGSSAASDNAPEKKIPQHGLGPCIAYGILNGKGCPHGKGHDKPTYDGGSGADSGKPAVRARRHALEGSEEDRGRRGQDAELGGKRVA